MRDPKCYTRAVMKEVLPKYCKGRAVDVGAGRAQYRNLIKQYADSYITVDNQSSDYEFGSGDIKPDIISDVLNMPLKDNSFDTVICTEVLEHVEDPFALMLEISRILVPGGHALVSSGWIAAYHREPKDYWRFSPDTYQLLCDKSNLELVEIRRQGGLFTSLLYLMRRNVDLNTVYFRKVYRTLPRVSKGLELVAEYLDNHFKTEDTVGHMVVARKK